mmetsp:Transcript_36828/g.109709  ORF Transcript_36828/g.109709 Transcript_36828/m.109709 type:complete len:383 (+) Transcript_36828:638-1786(+)
MLSRRARPPRGHADRAAAAVVLLWRGQDRALVRVRQRPLHAAVDAPRARAALARRLARPLSFPPLPDQVRAGRGARCSGRRVLGSARAAAALGRCGRLRDGFSRRDARLHPGDAGAARCVYSPRTLRRPLHASLCDKAPFDVYSWNLCFGLCVPLLFWRIETLGFDWAGLSQASPLLLVYLGAECLTCAAGNVLPDRLGYYISHRYWAGNWCMMLFYIRDTDAARAKLDAVKAFSPNPLRPPKLGLDPFLMDVALHKSLAYLWLGNLNTKCLVPLIEEACAAAGGAPSDFKAVPSLPLYFAGEFRDFLFGVELMGEMQAVAGFDAGECFAVKMSAFSMLGEGNRSEVHDLKKGRVRSYATSRAGLRAMDALPSSAPTFKKVV